MRPDTRSVDVTLVHVPGIQIGTCLDPVADRIYVPVLSGHRFFVVNPADQSVSPISTGVTATALAVNPVTNRIYLSGYELNGPGKLLAVVDGTSHSVTRIPLPLGQSSTSRSR